MSYCIISKKPVNTLLFSIYFSLLDINTTVSTWLDCSRWMSNPRKISPFVLGNKSTAFLTSKLPFSRPRTFSETGQCTCPYYIYAAAHIFQSTRHFALREYVRNPIVSTLILSMTEFVLFSTSTWAWIISSYLLWPICSFLNHKRYFTLVHKGKLS